MTCVHAKVLPQCPVVLPNFSVTAAADRRSLSSHANKRQCTNNLTCRTRDCYSYMIF